MPRTDITLESRGTVIVIIGIDRHIAFRIRGSGLSSSGRLFISQRDHAAFRIRLLYHTAFPVVLIGYDAPTTKGLRWIAALQSPRFRTLKIIQINLCQTTKEVRLI